MVNPNSKFLQKSTLDTPKILINDSMMCFLTFTKKNRVDQLRLKAAQSSLREKRVCRASRAQTGNTGRVKMLLRNQPSLVQLR